MMSGGGLLAQELSEREGMNIKTQLQPEPKSWIKEYWSWSLQLEPRRKKKKNGKRAFWHGD